MPDTPIVIHEDENDAAIITLNRPGASNSLNLKLICAVETAIEQILKARGTRCLIITGKGDKAFCAGADLKERQEMDDCQVYEFISKLNTLFTTIQRLPIPVIAAMNGAALGGGLELALAADIRIAAEHAVMGLPETRLGIIPGGGGTQRLPRLIGEARAKELIFTGRRVNAKEALNLGLVNRVTQAQDLMPQCLDMAGMIARNGPVAVEMAKYAITAGMQADLDTGLAIESNAYRIIIPTEDRLEALAAFKEKRAPRFKGK